MSSPRHNQLDINFVRSCFPTFEESLAAKTAFFENAGGSYVAGDVLDKLTHFYRVNKVQPYGNSDIVRAAGEQMDSGRQTIADLLGVEADTITLGASTTQNFNTLAFACAKLLKTGAEVIVTEQDHEANIGAWERLCERSNATLRLWQVDADTGELDISDFENLLTESTALVCMTHSSNIVGTVNPVERVIAMCRQNNSRIVIDGVSFAPHQWPDLPTLQPDAYCFSTYKTYATHLGVMYTAPDFNEQLHPQCHYFNRGYPQKRLDGAGPDHASIAALDGLGSYFSKSHAHHFGSSDESLYKNTQQISQLMHAHESNLCQQLLEGISDLPFRVIGRRDISGREATVALTSSKHSSQSISLALATQHIAAGNGHFYALRLLQKVGIKNTDDGVLRVSFSHYNNNDDVARLLAVLHSLH